MLNHHCEIYFTSYVFVEIDHNQKLPYILLIVCTDAEQIMTVCTDTKQIKTVCTHIKQIMTVSVFSLTQNRSQLFVLTQKQITYLKPR